MTILDVGHSPAKQVISSPDHVDGSFTDPAKIEELARKVDILTVEIEHVNVDVLERIAKETKVTVQPAPSTIRIIQDKLKQKEHLVSHRIPVAQSFGIESSPAALSATADKLGLPFMLKSRTLAYDGRGNFALQSLSQSADALKALGDRPLYAEKWAPFKCEIAVMVVRSATGEVRSYPAVETVHKDNICHMVFAPLRSSDLDVGERARKVAEDAVRTFEGAGVFGVEMFLMPDGTLYYSADLSIP